MTSIKLVLVLVVLVILAACSSSSTTEPTRGNNSCFDKVGRPTSCKQPVSR